MSKQIDLFRFADKVFCDGTIQYMAKRIFDETRRKERNRKVVQYVKNGSSIQAVANRFRMTPQHVRNIVREVDPSFSTRLPPRPPKPTVFCYCGKEARKGLRRFCSEAHAEAQFLFDEIVQYNEIRVRSRARYYLRNPEKYPGSQQWAKKVLRNPPGKKFIVRGTRTYRKLDEAGLISKLPAGIRVVSSHKEGMGLRRSA